MTPEHQAFLEAGFAYAQAENALRKWQRASGPDDVPSPVITALTKAEHTLHQAAKTYARSIL